MKTLTATISKLPSGNGHYKFTVRVEDEEYTHVTNSMTMIDSMDDVYNPDALEEEITEGIEATVGAIRETLEANGVEFEDVRHVYNSRCGHCYEVDVEEEPA